MRQKKHAEKILNGPQNKPSSAPRHNGAPYKNKTKTTHNMCVKLIGWLVSKLHFIYTTTHTSVMLIHTHTHTWSYK